MNNILHLILALIELFATHYYLYSITYIDDPHGFIDNIGKSRSKIKIMFAIFSLITPVAILGWSIAQTAIAALNLIRFGC